MKKVSHLTIALTLASIVLCACGSDSGGQIAVVSPPAPKDPAAIATLDKLKALGSEKERQDYMHSHQDEVMKMRNDPGAFAEAHKLAYGSQDAGVATPPPVKG